VAGDGEQPAAQVGRAPHAGVGRERLRPRLLGDIVPEVRPGEGMGEPGDVAPVGVDEVLEGRQGHDESTVCRPVV